MAASPPPAGDTSKRRLRPTAIAVVVVAIAVVIWLVARGGDDKPGGAGGDKSAGAAPIEATGKNLRAIARKLSYPVYWAGPIQNRKVELSQTSVGNVFVRYLPNSAPLGDKRPLWLTVGTYPISGAFEATKNAGRQPGTTVRRLPDGGVVVSGANSTSAYFSYPGSRVQVEVFSPAPGRALRMVAGGRIRAIRR
jgi:hypothetical protein